MGPTDWKILSPPRLRAQKQRYEYCWKGYKCLLLGQYPIGTHNCIPREQYTVQLIYTIFAWKMYSFVSERTSLYFQGTFGKFDPWTKKKMYLHCHFISESAVLQPWSSVSSIIRDSEGLFELRLKAYTHAGQNTMDTHTPHTGLLDPSPYASAPRVPPPSRLPPPLTRCSSPAWAGWRRFAGSPGRSGPGSWIPRPGWAPPRPGPRRGTAAARARWSLWRSTCCSPEGAAPRCRSDRRCCSRSNPPRR